MKLSVLFCLVPAVCLWGCGDPGPTSQEDAGGDVSADDSGSTDAGTLDDSGLVGSETSLSGCDCYACPYGLGCMSGHGVPTPNPTTMHYPHSYTYR